MILAEDHRYQREALERFGDGCLTTQRGMDWKIQGIVDDAEFAFEIVNGTYRRNIETGFYEAVFPYAAGIRLGERALILSGFTPNPYRMQPIRLSPCVTGLDPHPGSPDPDTACRVALRQYDELVQRFANEDPSIEPWPPVAPRS